MIVKTSVFYTIELVNSYFHLCDRGYHHDRVEADVVVAGTVDVNRSSLH
jgi:hypothetical protein